MMNSKIFLNGWITLLSKLQNIHVLVLQWSRSRSQWKEIISHNLNANFFFKISYQKYGSWHFSILASISIRKSMIFFPLFHNINEDVAVNYLRVIRSWGSNGFEFHSKHFILSIFDISRVGSPHMNDLRPVFSNT